MSANDTRIERTGKEHSALAQQHTAVDYRENLGTFNAPKASALEINETCRSACR